ncbi:MAG: bifunctional UDP-N-acetylglucosamine diphosphorylase/glucosamine-1-phosphate N-acetyltransferase GlmU [Nitrosomonas sp.]|jgi:bifunctional UDP-N-acetylglucosamine pyrophosphorylase/glucosamine-1-phosphate N-acetyltransferase|nr:bifunctional UDP-N-acetylglucosamine diphosphorylase/glucosamine-1-phosphate N-acetyltransferase GlmU [Nitrosomonas sp.]
MESKLHIVILAAGIGKRMKSSRPKVLHELAGKPMLSHVIESARALQPHRVCIVIGHGGEQIIERFSTNDLIWVEQKPQLGTGHALLQALPELDEEGATLVLYGDVPLVRVETLSKLVQAGSGDKYAILTTALENPYGYGRIIRNEDTRAITCIVEEKDATEAQRLVNEVNTGIMYIPNRKLHTWLPKLKNDNAQKEYYLTDLIKLAVAENIPIVSAQPDYNWEILGVNSRAQMAELERIYQKENASRLLEEGVTLYDPSRIDIRGQLECGSDVEIDVNCLFEGHVKLGNSVKIMANCVLKNVTVADGTVIQPFSHVENSAIGSNCKIGPYARIRPHTNLNDNVHIGNFVEIKQSVIAEGSKVNHLSYIGDTVMGSNVNVGAGTITCNYDGAHKHQTIIEDNVFIGSDTQLVAPVKISRGTTIGAGSTITKDTPENELTLSRVKQVTLTGWKRPSKQK